MLTFSQYLSERFLMGADGYSYSEIYVNPSNSDLQTVGRLTAPVYVPSVLEKFKSPCYYMGGLFTTKNFFIFNRDNIEHREATIALRKKFNPTQTQHFVAVYLYYFPQLKVISLDPATYSMGSEYAYGSKADEALRRVCKNHPALRGFTVVDSRGQPIT